jgi:hypothetical protein
LGILCFLPIRDARSANARTPANDAPLGAHWLVNTLSFGSAVLDEQEKKVMTGIYIMLSGMVLFATIVGIWDLVAERRNRRGATRR